MSKSTKKQSEQLKDSCRKERLREERHFVKQLLKEQRFEEVSELDDEITLKENEPE